MELRLYLYLPVVFEPLHPDRVLRANLSLLHSRCPDRATIVDFPFNPDVFDPAFPLPALDAAEIARCYGVFLRHLGQDRAHSFVVGINRYGRQRRRLDDAFAKAADAVRGFSGACRCMLEHMTDEEIAELRKD